jgi:heme/copper-type cytochrome/quinol oxidase subunit 3
MFKSFLPVVSCVSLTFFVNFLVGWLNLNFFAFFGLLFRGVFGFFVWMKSLTEETHCHMAKTHINLQMGMKFFLVSEAFLFFSFFWGYFNFCWSLELISGGFPFFASFLIDGFGVPMLNTTLLLTSGFYCTYGLHASLQGSFFRFFFGFLLSILLGVFFTLFQAIEYLECKVSITCGTYGSIFFLATGFHRAHVFIGTSFLIVTFFRGFFGQFSGSRFVGIVACIWYWHFVDVIWIYLYLLFYASYFPSFN